MIDFGLLFEQMFSAFWWTVPLFVLVALFKSAWFKGFIGEAMVNLAARLFLDKTDYHLIMERPKQLNNSCLSPSLDPV